MKTRRDVLVQAIDECVDEMFRHSEPPTSLEQLRKKKGEDTKEHPLFERHYLPQYVFTAILDSYLDAYGIKSQWLDYSDLVREYLKDGGPYTVYTEMDGKTFEHTKPLEELIGKENADIVFDLISKCQGFYRLNADEHAFRFNVCLGCSPTSNKERVEEYWKSVGKPITIDDSKWDDFDCFDEHDEHDSIIDNDCDQR